MLQILKSFDQTSIETRPSLLSGKWVVTPEYVVDSVRNGSWLPERSYEVAISTGSSAAFHPSRHWREKVATGRMTGAFQGWRVLLMVQEPGKRAMFKRWGVIWEKKKKIRFLCEYIRNHSNENAGHFSYTGCWKQAKQKCTNVLPPPTSPLLMSWQSLSRITQNPTMLLATQLPT